MAGDDGDRRRNSRPIAPCRLCWWGVCCCICVGSFQPLLIVHGEGGGWEGLGRGGGELTRLGAIANMCFGWIAPFAIDYVKRLV